MTEQSKRIVMLAGLAEWAARYQEAAELLFHSPTEYVEWVDGFRTDYARGCRDDEAMYWFNADDARQAAVKAIGARFQLKAAE